MSAPGYGSLSGHDFAGITVVMAHNPARMNPRTTSTTIQPKVRQKLLPLPSVTLPQFKYFSDAALCLGVERVLAILEDYCCTATTRPVRGSRQGTAFTAGSVGTFSGTVHGRRP